MWKKRGQPFHTHALVPGDVVGCLLYLPPASPAVCLREKELVDLHTRVCAAHFFYQQETKKPTVPLPGSFIVYFLNGKSLGVCAVDLDKGWYRPAVSLFGINAEVKINFGPRFIYPPECPVSLQTILGINN
ncbi:MAG: hypothetical protein EZS28_022587, partial [Streblomastix strix]